MKPNSQTAAWWKANPYFDLKESFAVPKAGGRFAYEMFWQPKNYAAFTYEVVRSLPNFKGISQLSQLIDLADLQAIRRLPPFPNLSQRKASCLIQAFTKRPAIRIVRHGGLSASTDYTAPLPPLAFARSAFSMSAILEFLSAYIEAQDKALNCEKGLGPKCGKSRNQDQRYKLGNWDSLDLLSPRDSTRPAFSRKEQAARSRAKKHGLKNYKLVLQGILLAQADILLPSFTPVVPSLVGKRFSMPQLHAALTKLVSKHRENKRG